MRRDKLTRTIFFGLFGIVTFLVLLFLANYSLKFIPIDFYASIVYFFNSNIRIVILISVLFLLSRLSELFMMPINLFSPLFKAVGAGVLIVFLSNILRFIIALSSTPFLFILRWIDILTDPIIIIVAGMIFVVGYFKILYGEVFSSSKKEVEKGEDDIINLKSSVQKLKSFISKINLKIKQRLT